ncbi:omega-amidase NIT2-like [Ixodes scapularis]|uniref:omega-amidase NIT2-like n=1 Tax=Ixodes scapularis TaxID=6945 RepID=UPI001A9E7139|nr:omega-amidase NIT2-like [Ixodes scapularis]
MAINKFRLALLQLAVTPNISKNLERASERIREAASAGAKMVCLPECFNFPYEPKYIAKYAEPIPGKTSEMLSRWASDNQVYLIGGTLSEREGDKLYTTCLAYGPDGSLLAKHRKVHLYATHVPSKFTFSEAGFLTPGDRVTTFDTPFCRVGVAVCYDIAFPSFAELYERLGCKLLLYPGAFNMYNGPLYWELLSRARAADNQLYVASVSPSRDKAAYYVLWGHSLLVDPTGKVVRSAGAGEEIVLADVDIKYLDSVRDQMSRTKHRRNDLYKVVVASDKDANIQASDRLRSAMSTAQ